MSDRERIANMLEVLLGMWRKRLIDTRHARALVKSLGDYSDVLVIAHLYCVEDLADLMTPGRGLSIVRTRGGGAGRGRP